VPLARSGRVTGGDATPRVSRALPDLTGFDVARIRVAVRGGKRVYERFLEVLCVSGDLPPTAAGRRPFAM
jgi:hypothetical protein